MTIFMMVKRKQQELQEIAGKVESCQKCSLYKQAKQAVAGEGNPEAEIFFVGEGPGYYEDQQGRPFVGAAGRLLDEMLKKIGLTRAGVFIGNMVKHRPPGNRDPQPEEIIACQQWLDQQLLVIKPLLIVTLGRFSMAKFIPDGKISQIHGQPRFMEFQDRETLIVPMFHPAAALRNGKVMEYFREDFLKLPDFLARFKKLVEELPKIEETGEEEVRAEKQMNLL